VARLPDPTQLPDFEGRKIYERLVAERGRIDGMYRALLNHPELLKHVSELGSYLRFGSGVVPDDLREMVILWVARRLGASYQWVKHVQDARKAGIPEKVIEALRKGVEPPELAPLQRAALAAARCVLDRQSIPQDVHDLIVGKLGLKGIIELVVLCSFYEMIAGVIFAFDVPLPDGVADPFA
jgi:4-carboxymuconolactone decarboxylase